MTAQPTHTSQLQVSPDIRLYTLEVEAYRSLPVNVFVVVRGAAARPDYCALVDVGSERPACFQQILGGFEQLQTQYGEQVTLAALDRIILTHEHPDHIGGLPFLQGGTQAPLAAHPLAAESIRFPVEAQQRSFAAQQDTYRWMGVPQAQADSFLLMNKRPIIPAGLAVAQELHAGERLDGLFDVIHVPGHAAGQVALRLGEVLLTADHLLPGSLPPLWPERVRPGLGLRNYLDSLGRVAACGEQMLALPSHGQPIERPQERIAEIRARVTAKLQRVRSHLAEYPGQTIYEVTQALYPNQPAPRGRLLLNQTATLLEYLAEEGLVSERPGGPDQAEARRWQPA